MGADSMVQAITMLRKGVAVVGRGRKNGGVARQSFKLDHVETLSEA
ncbi:hypothetical protein [Janthinobacterium sp. PC23-8]|nr:hypothetical protein [Janthinobacterium sp. PC23-8]